MLFASVFLSAVAAVAQPKEEPAYLKVRAEGHAEGIGYSARRAAIADAGNEAIGQMLETMVAREDLESVQTLLANAARYIDHTEVLRCDQTDGTTHVEADVFLLEDPIEKDLAEFYLPRLGGKPRVVLLIGEQLARDTAPAVLPGGLAEQTLTEQLVKKGMDILGVEAADPLFSHPSLIDIVTGDLDAAGACARGMPADVFVAGTVVTDCRPTAPGSNLYRCHAQIVLRAYRAFDGKMTDAVSTQYTVHAADADEGQRQAIRDACLKVTDPLSVAAIITVIGTRVSEDIQMTVTAPGDRARLDELLAALQIIPGVRDMKEMFFSDKLARVSFFFDGPMMILVDQVRGRVFGGLELKVDRVVGREMRVAF